MGIAFLLQVFLGPLGIGCFYLKWYALGCGCLFFGALGYCVVPIIYCFARTCFACFCCTFCRCIYDRDNNFENEDGVIDDAEKEAQAAAAFACIQFWVFIVGLICWIVALVEISTNCESKVDGSEIPCVPWA